MNLLLVIVVFALVLLAVGSGMGAVEISIWFVAQLAAIIFVVHRYMRQRRVSQ
ncbi:hypothetical protein [Streptomyces sp. NPDC127100]|uniref:hypothetical protein n=1 Tax=Streptomyces sp. NPDC127100 TaxID=3347138 RepID=UPI003667AB03